jgi:hypothetical protein
MKKLIRNFATSMLWLVGVTAAVLLLFAVVRIGEPVVVGAVLGCMLLAVVVELFHRDIDEGAKANNGNDSASASKHSSTATRLRSRLATGSREPVVHHNSRRASLRPVNHGFDSRDGAVDRSHPEVDFTSGIPVEHRAAVSEYLQSGLVLGMAIGECSVHDNGSGKIVVGPGVVRRFERAEKAYAELGYRPLAPVAFRRINGDSPTGLEAIGTRLGDGETPQLFAENVRKTHVR